MTFCQCAAESKKEALASGAKIAEEPEISPAREDPEAAEPEAVEAVVAPAVEQTAEKKKKKKVGLPGFWVFLQPPYESLQSSVRLLNFMIGAGE